MKKVFKKFVTMSIAAVMAVSAMSVSAFAAYDSVDNFNEPIATSYTVDENGKVELLIPSFFGRPTKPSNIAGNSTEYYLFDALQNKSHNDNVYTNYDAIFDFDFDTSCTAKTKQYAEFILGGPSSSNGQLLNFSIKGKSSSTSSTEYVNIQLISTGSADDIDLGKVDVKKSGTTSIRTSSLKKNVLYYVLVTPNDLSVGHAIHGTVTISN